MLWYPQSDCIPYPWQSKNKSESQLHSGLLPHAIRCSDVVTLIPVPVRQTDTRPWTCTILLTSLPVLHEGCMKIGYFHTPLIFAYYIAILELYNTGTGTPVHVLQYVYMYFNMAVRYCNVYPGTIACILQLHVVHGRAYYNKNKKRHEVSATPAPFHGIQQTAIHGHGQITRDRH